MSSGSSNVAAQAATFTNKQLAENYYSIAMPALSSRLGSINQSLGEGEPAFMQQAYESQRAGLTEGLAARGGLAQSQQMAGAKRAMSGGNFSASLAPADVGAQLANALYGSKYQEGQANLSQQFNLISMGLGGAGTTGNAALNASGQQLQAIGMLPGYNQTYANIAGGAAGLASIYGGMNQAGLFNSNPALTPGISSVNPATGGTFVA